jgi:isoleucyl-tRNA synthetase
MEKHTIIETMLGSKLVGSQYEPLFKYFESRRESHNCFSVIAATYVTNDAGTGIVHQAPGFGEDDYATCITAGLIEPGKAVVPIDSDGKFTSEVSDYVG